MEIRNQLVKVLRDDKEIIALNTFDNPNLSSKLTAIQKKAAIRDAKYNIEFLANSIEIESVANFSSYLIWLRDILKTYNIEAEMLIGYLIRLTDYLNANYDEELMKIVKEYIDEGINCIRNGMGEEYSYLADSGDLEFLTHSYFNALINMDKEEAVRLIFEAIDNEAISIEDLYLKVFSNVLYEIGRYWALRKISIGQEHFATAVTVYTMSLLYDKIFNNEHKDYKMLGICVGDELHEIGIRMVCDLFEINKWDTYYLGANVPNEAVLTEIKNLRPDVLAISVTLVNKIPDCKELIRLIRIEYPSVKIIVGGRPFNTDRNLWKQVGADGYSLNAKKAIEVASKLVGGIYE